MLSLIIIVAVIQQDSDHGCPIVLCRLSFNKEIQVDYIVDRLMQRFRLESWINVVKALVIAHRLLRDGDPVRFAIIVHAASTHSVPFTHIHLS